MKLPGLTVSNRTPAQSAEQADSDCETPPGPEASEFSALVRQHQSMVFSVAMHYLHEPKSAEEVAQDVFLQFYRLKDRLSGPEHVTAWLRKVACHRSIDYARSRRHDSTLR